MPTRSVSGSSFGPSAMYTVAGALVWVATFRFLVAQHVLSHSGPSYGSRALTAVADESWELGLERELRGSRMVGRCVETIALGERSFLLWKPELSDGSCDDRIDETVLVVTPGVGKGGFNVTSTCEFSDELCQGKGPRFENSTRDDLSSKTMSGN